MTQPIPFGKYLLLERINVGGMAEVFKAKAFGIEGFERILAIKRILPNMADDDEFINMFIDEARIAVQLSHANIVPIYELGKLDNQYYIAMEYVPGRDLRQLLDRLRKREERLPAGMAAFITSKICEGLDYAHRKADVSGKPLGVIHRDVSPQNILLGFDGAVKITDFGIVKAEDRASKTQAGVLKGKFAYMSPEQVRGLEIDHRSDIFAVGILLYEMLTGQRLFIGESDFATLEKVRAAEVVPPQEHNPDIPQELGEVVLKALARERDERYASAIELADDLQPFMNLPEGRVGTKRLLDMMRGEYGEEMNAEQQRMETYVNVAQPSTTGRRVVDAHLAAPTADWDHEGRGEKTMIFQSDFAAHLSGPTSQHTQQLDLSSQLPSERPTEAMDGLSVAAALRPIVPTSRLGRFSAVSKKVWLAAGICAALLIVFAAVLLPSATDGSLNVTSVPTTAVNLYLDGVLIAQHTPYTQEHVATGEHRLVARAGGFRDKAYRFDLAAGAPADIRVELEREASLVMPGEASLEVTSEPQMASVRMGGLPQGATPVTLDHPDTGHPIVLEVSKPGFSTQTVTVRFAADERHKSVHVRLPPVGTGIVAGEPNSVMPSGFATLTVTSSPPGGVVFVGGVQRGLAPVRLTGMSANATYAVEVTKEGFRSVETIVHMGGREQASVQAQLVPLRVYRGRSGTSAGCGGSGSKLSVMALDVSDCRVTVGRQGLGVAPMFKKDGPVGRCPIDVRCPGGKHYSVIRYLRFGSEEKLIIKPNDWQ